MKGLILSFFVALLGYSLFFDSDENKKDIYLLPLDSTIQREKANVMSDTTSVPMPGMNAVVENLRESNF